MENADTRSVLFFHCFQNSSNGPLTLSFSVDYRRGDHTYCADRDVEVVPEDSDELDMLAARQRMEVAKAPRRMWSDDDANDGAQIDLNSVKASSELHFEPNQIERIGKRPIYRRASKTAGRASLNIIYHCAPVPSQTVYDKLVGSNDSAQRSDSEDEDVKPKKKDAPRNYGSILRKRKLPGLTNGRRSLHLKTFCSFGTSLLPMEADVQVPPVESSPLMLNDRPS